MAEGQRQSFLSWMLTSLGPVLGVMILTSGLLLFVGACVVVFFQRRPAVIAAYLALVPLPLAIGLIGMFWGAIRTLSMIATSPVAPKPSDIAGGVSLSLFAGFSGLLACFPAYLVASLGLFGRIFLERSQSETIK